MHEQPFGFRFQIGCGIEEGGRIRRAHAEEEIDIPAVEHIGPSLSGPDALFVHDREVVLESFRRKIHARVDQGLDARTQPIAQESAGGVSGEEVSFETGFTEEFHALDGVCLFQVLLEDPVHPPGAEFLEHSKVWESQHDHDAHGGRSP